VTVAIQLKLLADLLRDAAEPERSPAAALVPLPKLTISRLPPNWQASPGVKLSGMKAAVMLCWRRYQAA
jgi:hypothetical protein